MKQTAFLERERGTVWLKYSSPPEIKKDNGLIDRYPLEIPMNISVNNVLNICFPLPGHSVLSVYAGEGLVRITSIHDPVRLLSVSQNHHFNRFQNNF